MHVDVILGRKGRQVHIIPAAAPVREAVDLMASRGVSALVVSEDGAHVDGIVSDRDVVRAVGREGGDALGRPVEEIMTRDVITCRGDDPIVSLMTVMTLNRIRHLPVVDGEDRRLVGLVSIGDVVKHRLDEIEMEAESLRDYITRTR